MTASTWFRPAIAASITLLAAGTLFLPRTAAGTFELPEVSLGQEVYAETPVPQPNRAAQTVPEAPTLPQPEKDYIVRLSGDAICVFEAGSRNPIARYEFHDEGMPDYDRILLEFGIRVNGEEALREVLEDYVS